MSTPAKETTEVQKAKEERAVEFIPFGGTDKVRLTASMVRQFIAVPTKSGKLPSERDCIRFIMLCRGKRANPFEGDCFMIGYDSQYGASFSMVCGIELFQKRAEQSVDYDGRESGVIVANADGVLQERNGSLLVKGEILVGGWAKVYRKDRKFPEYKTVTFSTYDTGKSRWEKDPGGMIEKVALSQALRGAYPTALGGLYTQEEMTKLTEAGMGMLTETDREPIAMPKALDERPTEPPQKPEPASDTPPAKDVVDPLRLTVQEELAEFVETAGVAFDDLRDFLKTKGLVEDAGSFGSIYDLPDSVCKKLKADSKVMAELVKKFGKRGQQ